jgi:uncharacterized membrane protein YfcA
MNVPLPELVWLVVAVAAAGAVTGLLAGLFGIGGGAVIVPVLYEAFTLLGVPAAVRMQLCIGTSLAIIVPTTLRAYRTHLQRDLVVREVIGMWWLPAILGVATGAAAAVVAPAGLFKVAFALIAGLIAAKLLFGREGWVVACELPGRWAMAGYGFLVGLASSLIGISGGSIVTMILTLHGKPIHNAVATAAGIGVPIAIAGTIGYAVAGLPHLAQLPPLSVGFVSIVGVLAMAPVSSSMAPVGARLAHRLPRRGLEIAFGLFLLAAASRFVIDLI